ncbi:uncharacterized protein LACBIDRAFT_329918 [Laccaria bicolor S238N-H82]|uniref:Predicted protein n=1 Tax=Laccaria bicolor (strain S238N-H82 / ATCC MYA-4686) TaxID=486041 RepID=B0DJM0_LACBS|nr:uncharacterized protein LACBIDRAFT_329918 [Laccaria bicolor S238N-H82]EDR05231.1 predicted protein [Laccaria bicolor S238N-H82]|eukprot:XP_001884196.1 predicted protein [Laccaria bicolor S238N-H82]
MNSSANTASATALCGVKLKPYSCTRLLRSRDLSSRRTFCRIKWHPTKRSEPFSLLTSKMTRYYLARQTAVEPLIQGPQYALDQPPNCPATSTCISKLPCTSYDIPELHNRWCLLPWIPRGGGISRQLDALHINIELRVVCRGRVIPQRFVPTNRSVSISVEACNDGLRAAHNPWANAAQACKPQDAHLNSKP